MRQLLPALLVLAACRTESLSVVSTSEVTANITVETEGTGSTNIAATFRKGITSLTFLQLTTDDKVSVTSGSQTAKLSETSLFGVVTYSASLPIDTEGTMFTVKLERVKDSGAPSSVATLPAAFTLTAPSGSFSRAAAGPTFTLSNGSTNESTLGITGSCIDAFATSLTSGATDYTLAAGALHKRQSSGGADGGTTVPDNCEVTVRVDRTLNGTLDTGYANGGISGIQRRELKFTSIP